MPGVVTQQASIAPTAASTALPPRERMSRPAAAAAGCGVATAAVGRGMVGNARGRRGFHTAKLALRSTKTQNNAQRAPGGGVGTWDATGVGGGTLPTRSAAGWPVRGE